MLSFDKQFWAGHTPHASYSDSAWLAGVWRVASATRPIVAQLTVAVVAGRWQEDAALPGRSVLQGPDLARYFF